MPADTLLADKAFDADERVIEPLLTAGKTPVIPPKSNRKIQRTFDKEMYKARHLIENFFCKLKQFRAIPPVTIKRRESSPESNWLRLSFYLIEDRP
jgi:transposase